jgi:hypothetical protein
MSKVHKVPQGLKVQWDQLVLKAVYKGLKGL